MCRIEVLSQQQNFEKPPWLDWRRSSEKQCLGYCRKAERMSDWVTAGKGLIFCAHAGAWLGGARRIRASLRVLVGGWLAFAITYGVRLSPAELDCKNKSD